MQIATCNFIGLNRRALVFENKSRLICVDVCTLHKRDELVSQREWLRLINEGFENKSQFICVEVLERGSCEGG